LGAAAIGFGIYKHVNSNKLYDDYKKMPANLPNSQYNETLKKANDGQQMRNIGLSVGCALLAAGVTVHILF